MCAQSNPVKEEEVFIRKGQVMSSTARVHTQAVYLAPMSAHVEDARSNSGGLVRRGAIKRKNTTESNLSRATADRYKTDTHSTSRRFSFDRQASVRFAPAATANVGRHRSTGHEKSAPSSRAEPRLAMAAGKPQPNAPGRHQSRFNEMFGHASTTFDEILGKGMSRLTV